MSSPTSWGELAVPKRYLESGKGEDSLELELGASASRVHMRKSSIGGRRLSGILQAHRSCTESMKNKEICTELGIGIFY